MTHSQPPLDDGPPRPGDDAADWDALARYFARESPAAEAIAVERWLAAHPADAAALAAVADATAPARPAPVDVEGALRRVRERVAAGEAAPAARGTPVVPLRQPARVPEPPRRAWVAGGMAAAAAVLLAVGVARTRDAAAPGAARVYATAVGVRDSVELPDGTRVLLAPASRLVVAAGYGGAHRDATLEGAASFVVRHDAARPFTVRAGAALVRDLGTAFAVRTDGAGGAGGVTVAVTEGVVALRPATPATAADTGVLLNAGDRGVLRAGAAAEAARGAVTADDVAWTRGRLVYRDAPLDELRADLRRWYGVELRVDDPALAGRRLTATFDGEPADRVLDVVATALGAEVERTGGAAVLRSARAGRASGRPR